MTKKTIFKLLSLTFIISLLTISFTNAQCTAPPNFNGRIAWTADGNESDRDEYLATPYMAAILQAANTSLVHFAYNDQFATRRDPNQTNGNVGNRPDVMRATVQRALGAYNSLGTNIFDCDGDETGTETQAALDHLAGLIRDASSSTRLYICIAGGARYVGLALERAVADPATTIADLNNVTIVSHSNANNLNSRVADFPGPGNNWNMTDIEAAAEPGGIFEGLVIANYANSGSIHNEELFVNTSNYQFIFDNQNQPLINPIFQGYEDSRKANFDPSDAGMAYMVLYFTNAITLANAALVQPENFVQEAMDLNSGDIFCTSNNTSDFFYIQNRANSNRLITENSTSGARISHQNGATGLNAQWEMVESNNGFFYLLNRGSGMYIRPLNSNDAVNIIQRPTSFSGNFTQWQQIPTSNGFFRLQNRATGKYFRPEGNGNVRQRPTTFSGNQTQWQFVPVTSSKSLENSVASNSTLSVFPNPVINVLNVTTPFEIASEATINISTINGAIVISQKLTQSQQIEVSNLDSGLYIIQIDNGSNSSVTKFIKQ